MRGIFKAAKRYWNNFFYQVQKFSGLRLNRELRGRINQVSPLRKVLYSWEKNTSKLPFQVRIVARASLVLKHGVLGHHSSFNFFSTCEASLKIEKILIMTLQAVKMVTSFGATFFKPYKLKRKTSQNLKEDFFTVLYYN